MKSVLESSIDSARRRSSQLVLRAADAVANGVARPLLPGVAPSGRNVAPTQTSSFAAEQIRHFKGWVFSSIRPIANRIADQAIRVARVYPSGKGRGRKKTPSLYQAPFLPKSLKRFEIDHGAEVLSSHPLIDAINDPNAFMTHWALLYTSVCSLEVTGRATWWVKRKNPNDREDRSWEVWPVPSHWIEPVHTENTPFAYWKMTVPDGPEPIDIPTDEIVYFYYPDFTDPLGTFSPMQAQAKAIVTDEHMQEAQQKGFVNGINPGWLLTLGKVPDASGVGPGSRPILTAEQRAQLIHAVKSYYRGASKFDEPLILDGLIESATRARVSNPEMGFAESGKILKDRINQGFGTSPVMMGHLENANRASSLVAEENFLKNTVNPKISLMSECMTAWLGPRFAAPGERLLVYVETATTTDPELEFKQTQASYDRAGVSINYMNAKFLGLPPMKGGNVCFIRPELVPYVLPDENGEIDVENNPFVRQYNDRVARSGPPPLVNPPNDNLRDKEPPPDERDE